MKKLSVLFLSSLILFGLLSKADTPPLFQIDKELDSYKKTVVTEDDEERYSEMEFYLLTGGPGTMVW